MNPQAATGRLVVVPSDPLEAYERAGYENLEDYYNPGGRFAEVFAVSPLEKGRRTAHGMTVIGAPSIRVRGVIRRLEPDAVRAYGGYWPADIAAASRSAGVAILVSVHATSAPLHPSVVFADLVLCTSGAVERTARDAGVDPRRMRRLPNRVDFDVFNPRETAGGPIAQLGPGPWILHVGRRSSEKNLDTLIRALARLPSDYAAVFIGQGDKTPYESLANELLVADRCHWIDAVPNSELPAWYAGCDCFCVPSRNEGFGTVFLEAAACGAAIVTSDIAPMNEYLSNGVSGTLVRGYENPDALAEAIRHTVEDAAYRAVVTEGAQRAAQPFGRETIDALEAAYYDEAIALARHRRGFDPKFERWRWKAKIHRAVIERPRALRKPRCG